MPRGGKREGAGRPLTAGETGKRRTLRASDEEWTLHQKFDKLLKYGDKQACIDFIESQENK